MKIEKVKDNSKTISLLRPILIGAFLVFVGIILIFSIHDTGSLGKINQAQLQTVDATVQGYSVESNSNQPGETEKTAVVLETVLETGEKIRATSALWMRKKPYALGETVTALFDPKTKKLEPKALFAKAEALTTFYRGIAVILIGVGVLVIASAFFFYRRKEKAVLFVFPDDEEDETKT